MSREPRILSRPEPGYFAIRFVRGGPRIPARLYWSIAADPETGEPLDRSSILLAQIGNLEPSADRAAVERLWTSERIDESEYRYLLSVRDWALNHAPTAPEAQPWTPIDLTKLPPLF